MNDVAMAQAVQEAAKPKFRGHTVLKSKVVPHYPENLEREYTRLTNTYMTLLNLTLKEHLPIIRRAIAEERDGARRDDENGVMSVISQQFMKVQEIFEKKAVTFGLERKLENLAKLTRKLSIREWKRVVNSTLGINIVEDYYMGEFYSGMMRQWTTNNVGLIKSIPSDALSLMRTIVVEGYFKGKSNTTIGREIQNTYGVNRSKAQMIARDQVNKLNADMTQTQQQDAGVEEYVWTDSGDSKVRQRHKELNGKTFKWSDPPVVDQKTGRRAHPGEDYQCRCIALPKFNLPGLNLPWES